MTTELTRRKPRRLALDIVDDLSSRIGDGRLTAGAKLPSESAVMADFGVSRTVVREALSRLQASGLVVTHHGVGTFVRDDAAASTGIRLPGAVQASTLRDALAVVELRLGLEGEAAALAAVRRSDEELAAMRAAQRELADAIDQSGDTVTPDRRLHELIASATHNAHFVELTRGLGALMIPRTRVDTASLAGDGRREYFLRLHAEHESVVNAIANRDPEAARAAIRTHLSNSRDRLRRARDRQAERTVEATPS